MPGADFSRQAVETIAKRAGNHCSNPDCGVLTCGPSETETRAITIGDGLDGLPGALLWHFAAMWLLVINGLAYVTYGFVTGRFRRMLLPIRLSDIIANVRDALRFRLAHDDPTQYNAVQRILYIGVLLAGVMIVISGLAIWKPVQFSELLALFGGSFQAARVVHFLCMAAIVGFVAVHVSLALLVPHTLVAMVTGGPTLPEALPRVAPAPTPAAQDATP